MKTDLKGHNGQHSGQMSQNIKTEKNNRNTTSQAKVTEVCGKV